MACRPTLPLPMRRQRGASSKGICNGLCNGTCNTPCRAPKGFTLIELLVVLSMVALLLTIALPRYFASLDQARDTALRENLKVLRLTLDRFHADKGHLPARLDDLVEQKYLRSIPPDPVTGSPATWIVLHGEDAADRGVADVRSGAAGAGQDGVAYAEY